MNKILELAKMSDEAFFEQYLSDLSVEELAAFMEEFPEFLTDKTEEVPDRELFERIKMELKKGDYK